MAEPNAAAGPSAPPKRQGRVALAILSVTAVLAASTFAVFALTRPDGAASPEAAVEALFAALEAEDAIGVMESLPPGEREVLLEPMIATVAEFQRLGLLDSFELEDVPGTDIEVDGLTLSSTELGDGVTSVRVTGGTITGTVIPDEVPIGPRTRELAEREGGEPIEIQAETDTSSLADANLELVTVEADGGWHVSLFYTIAEGIRGDDTPLPPFGAGITPIGADTPEGAVRGLIEAGIALDLERAVGHLPPDELRVLYDYVPLFLDDANAAAEEARSDGFSVTLDRLDLQSSGDGDVRQVTISAIDVSAGEDDGSFRYSWDGTCTVVEGTSPDYGATSRFQPINPDGSFEPIEPYEPAEMETTTFRAEVCTDGRTTFTEDGETIPSDEMDPFGSVFAGQTGTFGQSATVVEVDGRWYVSPVRTMFDAMLGSLRALEGDDIDGFVESWGSWFGSSSMQFESVGEPIEGPMGTIPYQPDLDDPYFICSSVYDQSGPDASMEDYEALDEEYDQCLLDNGAEPFPEYESFGSPRIVGDRVLVVTDEMVKGFDLQGNELFEGPECDFGDWASPIPGAGTTIEVAQCDDELVGVDAATGDELWRIDATESYELTRIGPRALVRQRNQEVVAYDLATGEVLWRSTDAGDAVAVADDRNIYVANEDGLVAFDLDTGDQVWSSPIWVTGIGVADGALVARVLEPRELVRLDPATGATLWTSEPGDEGQAYTDVAGFTSEVVLVTGSSGPEIMAYDLTTGELLWSRSDTGGYRSMSAGGSTVVLTDEYDGEILIVDHRTGVEVPGVSVPSTTWSATVSGNTVAYVYEDDDGTTRVGTVTVP